MFLNEGAKLSVRSSFSGNTHCSNSTGRDRFNNTSVKHVAVTNIWSRSKTGSGKDDDDDDDDDIGVCPRHAKRRLRRSDRHISTRAPGGVPVLLNTR